VVGAKSFYFLFIHLLRQRQHTNHTKLPLKRTRKTNEHIDRCYTKTLTNIQAYPSPNTDDVNESEIFDRIKFDGIVNVVIPYWLPTATNWSVINLDKVNNITLSLDNVFCQNNKRRWSLRYDSRNTWQKYCNGLTLSLQQQRNICLKLLFQATFVLCKLESFKDHVSVARSGDQWMLCFAKAHIFIFLGSEISETQLHCTFVKSLSDGYVFGVIG